MNLKITLDGHTLATMVSEEFEVLAFRLAILQASSVPVVQASSVPSVPSVKRASGASEHGPNVQAYLANNWPDGKGGAFKVERFRLGEIARAQFAALETPLLDPESIALACLQASKPIGGFFAKGKAEGESNGGEIAATESVQVDELDEDDI